LFETGPPLCGPFHAVISYVDGCFGMIEWLKNRIGSKDSTYRSAQWNWVNRPFIYLGVPFGVFLCARIATTSVNLAGYAMGAYLGAAVVAGCIRMRLMSLRFSDPLEIDNFWMTKYVALDRVDHFETEDRWRGRTTVEVHVVLTDGSSEAIPSLQQSTMYWKHAFVGDARVAAERFVDELNERLAEVRATTHESITGRVS
jgi:hypothetical protein